VGHGRLHVQVPSLPLPQPASVMSGSLPHRFFSSTAHATHLPSVSPQPTRAYSGAHGGHAVQKPGNTSWLHESGYSPSAQPATAWQPTHAHPPSLPWRVSPGPQASSGHAAHSPSIGPPQPTRSCPLSQGAQGVHVPMSRPPQPAAYSPSAHWNPHSRHSPGDA
jgi:hypothetical protein